MFNSSCSKSSDAKRIEVEIWHNGSLLDCNAFTSHQQVWFIQQLAFFISRVKFSDENTEHQPQLITTPWQTDGVALIQPYLADCDAISESENKLSATQEIEKKYSIPVFSLINLEDIIHYLETKNGFTNELELIKKYQKSYGVI